MVKKILILDDEESIRVIVSKLLKMEGYKCETTSSLMGAKELINSEHFDVVLCDIFLGEDESGLDFLKYCSENHKDVATIMLTGLTKPEISNTAIELGSYGYVTKPFNHNQLLITINSALKRLELEKEREEHLKKLDLLVMKKTEHLSKNIVELEETKRKLQKSEETFRSIFKNMQEGYYRTDLEGNILMVNPTAKKIIGYDTDEDVIGLKISSLYVNPEIRESVIEELFKKGQLSNIETQIKRRDGKIVTVLAASHLLYDENEEPWAIEGIFYDISKRVDLEIQVAESRKLRAIGQLASGIAHEINTPTQYVGDNTLFLKDAFADLYSLINRYEHLLDRAGNGDSNHDLIGSIGQLKEDIDLEYLMEEIPKAIDQSLEGVNRVAKIVRSMKRFSHPGKEKALMDINSAILDTLSVSRNEWKYVAEVVKDFDSNLPEIMCFPGELNQVFLNMIINAAHAISDMAEESGRGTITISTELKNNFIEIRFKDTGKGIPLNIQKNIFDPFFTTKGIGKGTGQGLAISKSVIVEKHGGYLNFESVVGAGTTFIIKLPIVTEQE